MKDYDYASPALVLLMAGLVLVSWQWARCERQLRTMHDITATAQAQAEQALEEGEKALANFRQLETNFWTVFARLEACVTNRAATPPPTP